MFIRIQPCLIQIFIKFSAQAIAKNLRLPKLQRFDDDPNVPFTAAFQIQRMRRNVEVEVGSLVDVHRRP